MLSSPTLHINYPLNSVFILTLDAASPHLSTAASPWEWVWASNLLFSSLRPSDTLDTNMYILDKSVEWVGGEEGEGEEGKGGGLPSICMYM